MVNFKTGLFLGTVITVALLVAFIIDRKAQERAAMVAGE